MAFNINISERISDKLAKKHKVTPEEINQCFANRAAGFLEDSREDHKTDPPTQWFIAPTNRGRLLKIVFVQLPAKDGVKISLKTAYEPNATEIRIYDKFA